ncbi:hypothetical protein EJ04DRAFT_15627 [Polyplosphaeria fusca]|uniref:Uncharacterized protein n=1 Tax=Polyplosphaeria fusca TaxID=682080 RepID=A0A9P4UWL8_9PLEO|nr:hypothetical protein EJ04DRAFT_15627 [Polyplosphaeria fusca]
MASMAEATSSRVLGSVPSRRQARSHQVPPTGPACGIQHPEEATLWLSGMLHRACHRGSTSGNGSNGRTRCLYPSPAWVTQASPFATQAEFSAQRLLHHDHGRLALALMRRPHRLSDYCADCPIRLPCSPWRRDWDSPSSSCRSAGKWPRKSLCTGGTLPHLVLAPESRRCIDTQTDYDCMDSRAGRRWQDNPAPAASTHRDINRPCAPLGGGEERVAATQDEATRGEGEFCGRAVHVAVEQRGNRGKGAMIALRTCSPAPAAEHASRRVPVVLQYQP